MQLDTDTFLSQAQWLGSTPVHALTDGILSVLAEAGTDLLVDPVDGEVRSNAAVALVDPPDGDWQFSARVSVGFAGPWDAGAVIIWSDREHWAKLTFEQAPDGAPSVYSVVTRGRSDDAVGRAAPGGALWLRVSRVDGAFVLHTSAAGSRWQLVRQFTLGTDRRVRVGIGAQSPAGQGCRVSFDSIRLTPTRLAHLFDGG